MSLRWDVPGAATLDQLIQHLPVRGVHLSTPRATYYRDVYCDSPEGDLRRSGARCRMRFTADGSRRLAVWMPDRTHVETHVTEHDPLAALAGESGPVLRLRALIDTARLVPWIERDVARRRRTVAVPIAQLPLCDVVADAITVRRGALSAALWELSLRPRAWGRMTARTIARQVLAVMPLHAVGNDPLLRAEAALQAAEAQILARDLRGDRDLAVVAVEHGRLGLCRLGAELRIPIDHGSGEAACRDALRRLVGSGEGELRLLGVVPASEARATLEVWTARRLHGNAVLQWFSPKELLERVGSPVLRDPASLAALTVAARSPLVPEWSAASFDDGDGDAAPEAVARASRATLSDLRTPVLAASRIDPAFARPEQFLSAELSWLEFNARVLALAEDPRTPAAAQIRFLGIVSTNLDDFAATKIGALKQLAMRQRRDPSADGLRPQETLDAIAIRLRPLLARQYRLFDALLRSSPGAARPGLSVAYWAELSAGEQEALRTHFRDAIMPFLGPKALTRAPGHPFPDIDDRRLVLLVVLRDCGEGPQHYATVEVPEIVPRFEALADGRRWLPIEDLIRANLSLLFPGQTVVGAHAFRLTRSGDLQLDESSTANFLQAIEEELARRQQRPVVRIEIESATPEPLHGLLQRAIRFEESDQESTLDPSDVYVAAGPLQLGDLRDASLPRAASLADYPPLAAREPFDPQRPVADQLDERDVLVHHPFDSFTSSFERFIAEAADDPDVHAIKLTLYRPGGAHSAIGDALRRAAASGKDVSVIVELKARFDEARNIAWARGLEQDGVHVVTGLMSFKTHAKIALVVRRRGEARRYAHVGSGNYNPDSALAYTDVGLFTADRRITADVHTLFNELIGSGRPPRGGLRHLLVAPADLLDRLLALIERETAHARAGRPAGIRAKLNGLADSTVIEALYRASQAGVNIDLVVRGICALRPGVPGLSERIRVVSILGRFLEHARVYHFTNGEREGGEYYIGSADWRPRNLRRRVEVVVPVFDPAARRRLNDLLTTEVATQDAWLLRSDGGYDRLDA